MELVELYSKVNTVNSYLISYLAHWAGCLIRTWFCECHTELDRGSEGAKHVYMASRILLSSHIFGYCCSCSWIHIFYSFQCKFFTNQWACILPVHVLSFTSHSHVVVLDGRNFLQKKIWAAFIFFNWSCHNSSQFYSEYIFTLYELIAVGPQISLAAEILQHTLNYLHELFGL